MHQVMQVSKSLAESKGHLMLVKRTAEQYRQYLHCGLRFVASRQDLATTRAVMGFKGRDPPVQPKERQVVRRQNERFLRNHVAQFGKRT